jgi:urease beta subunit
MGSSQHAADPATQAAASAGAQAQAQAAANLSNTYNQEQQQQYKSLFGTGGVNGGGTLSKFLDPNSLNVSAPTGPYALQYKQATGNLAQQTAQQKGQLAQSLANNGFGSNSPSGMAQDANLQLALGQNAQQGQLFTQAATNSYNDALNNFWNATNIGAGQAATAQSGALSGTGIAAQTDANLYGTASQPYAQQGIGGALLGAGAQAGSAAIMCPVTGSKILMANGKLKNVELLVVGDKVLAIDGSIDTVTALPKPSMQKTVRVSTKNHSCHVSNAHWFDRPVGYSRADEAEGDNIKTESGTEKVVEVLPLGEQEVWDLTLSPSHSYNVDGFWSLG